MEDPKPASVLNPNPTMTTASTEAGNLPSSQPQHPHSTPFSHSPSHHQIQRNKRKLVNDDDSHYSNYFKICKIVKDLRPHFIEVLQTPDFRNSKAAEEIQKHMKLLMDLYKQMISERPNLKKCLNSSAVLPCESKIKEDPLERQPKEQPQSGYIPPEKLNPPSTENNSNKKFQDCGNQGSYIVGGSNFGSNFIIFPGSKPIYYGVTKESRRSKVAD